MDLTERVKAFRSRQRQAPSWVLTAGRSPPVVVAMGDRLTLLLIGAAPKLGFQTPPPGDLGDLAAQPVLVMAAILWVLELWAERRWISALGWNLAQGLVRPLAGALLAFLLVPDAGPVWRWGAAAVAAAVALWTQAG